MVIEGRENPKPGVDPEEKDVSPEERLRRAEETARSAGERLRTAEERLRSRREALGAEEEKTNAEIDLRFKPLIEKAEAKERALHEQARRLKQIEDQLGRRAKR
jgi:hypothetical protein